MVFNTSSVSKSHLNANLYIFICLSDGIYTRQAYLSNTFETNYMDNSSYPDDSD